MALWIGGLLQMKKNDLLKYNDKLVRVLDIQDDKYLIIDCIKRTMPVWVDSFKNYEPSNEEELYEITEIKPSDKNENLSVDNKYIQEHYSLIAGILPYIGNEKERSKMIRSIAEYRNVSKQTIRYNLCLYLVYQNISILARKNSNTEKQLTEDEENMRWALNKYYYTQHKNKLTVAYTYLLKEKYTDKSGTLVQHPSIYQFRYFYRKTKNMQNYYISRDGIKNYQRNHRPLLGEGVQSFASNLGVGMLDSTICDIYLINEKGQVIGRPVMTACVDAYSGLCCGYSLGWEGGTYSLRSLMLNIISDKKEYCKKFGIELNHLDWNCHHLPATLVTDKGSEYASEHFEQLTDFGVSIVNLPAYRPELKGSIEKLFDVIQETYKPYLKGKGVIEPDFQERGAHDYRKDACITLEQFEKIIIYCIIYYNSKRIVESFPYTQEMLDEGVKPHASEIWNFSLETVGTNLLNVSRQEMIMCLLPRKKGKFTRSGLKVNGLRYKHESYTEMYLVGGEITVAYNPEDVSNVWLIEKNGRYVKFDLIDSRYSGLDLESVETIKTSTCQLIKSQNEENLQAKVALAQNIEAILSTGLNPVDKGLHNMRQNRRKEQQRTHIDFLKDGDF